ncbi:hypothetical protein L1987_09518 [Smallanthus sonchifolius]|uniref:Uncharacterized protein n=1 Tax=Smallanthus sonchifolius TaxID=185202 RepID=A0ACB9JP13_9ASTR|nr:hypothetical protein L1987_09518 [Smallanthus sonchifolius]
MPFALRKLRKVLITSEAWSKCALGQIVSKGTFFHSRKYSIGVVLSLEVSILFPSTALSEPTVYEQLSWHNAIFSETGVGLFMYINKAESCL